MAIILKNVRLSNDVFRYDVMECVSGIDGLVNLTQKNMVPFITLEFYDSETKQKAIRRYFMKKNATTGEYDQWDGKSPYELKSVIGITLPGVFVTRNGLTICLFEHEMNSQIAIDKVFETEAYLGFDIVENREGNMSDSLITKEVQNDEERLQESKATISSDIREKPNSTNVNYNKIEPDGTTNSLTPIVVIIVLVIGVILLFSAANGALNGIADVLSSIPKWLRIILFVSVCLIIGGGIRSNINGNNTKNN